MAPDQCGWLPLWVHSAGSSLKAALAKMKYKEPVEMAACFGCLACDSELEKFTPRQLEEGLSRVKTARKVFAKEHNGFEGNPAMIFKEVLGNRQR